MYRALVLGCGARAHCHARVYPVEGIEIVACCDIDAERREAFAKTYGIPATYDDYEKALAEVQPEVVHIVTNPVRRVWEAETTAKAGVKAMILEKPIAVRPGELRGLAEVRSKYDMEIITNSQRRCFPETTDGVLHEVIREKLGDVYFVRCSTRGNLMGMGPHLMDWLLAFLGDPEPQAVWATGSGRSTEGYQATHIAPEHVLAEYWFPGDVRVVFDCDPDALGTPKDPKGFNCHLDFLGSRGRLYISQIGSYFYQTEGMAEPVRHTADENNHDIGQRELTRKVVEMLAEGTPHPLRFEVGERNFRALFAAEQSMWEGRRIELPARFEDEDWEKLIRRLEAGSAG
ncbi:MAG: Gfo/Idh/MocA family oxidoreductase [Armatimonadia bacterium]